MRALALFGLCIRKLELVGVHVEGYQTGEGDLGEIGLQHVAVGQDVDELREEPGPTIDDLSKSSGVVCRKLLALQVCGDLGAAPWCKVNDRNELALAGVEVAQRLRMRAIDHWTVGLVLKEDKQPGAVVSSFDQQALEELGHQHTVGGVGWLKVEDDRHLA